LGYAAESQFMSDRLERACVTLGLGPFKRRFDLGDRSRQKWSPVCAQRFFPPRPSLRTADEIATRRDPDVKSPTAALVKRTLIRSGSGGHDGGGLEPPWPAVSAYETERPSM